MCARFDYMRIGPDTRNWGRNTFDFLTSNGFLPTELQEAELFVLGATFLSLLVILTSGLWGDLETALRWEAEAKSSKKGGVLFSVAMLIVGSFVSVYIALTRRPLGNFASYAVKFFFPVVHAALAIALGFYTLHNPTTWNYILSGWQFLQAAAFILFTGQEEIGDFYALPKRQARRNEIILGSLCILTGLALGVLNHWYWAVTFSTILFIWRTSYSFIAQTLRRPDLLLNSPIVG